MSSEECLDIDVLHQASLGLLDEAAQRHVDAHVDGCASCRRSLAEATRLNQVRTSPPTMTVDEDGEPVALVPGSGFGRYKLLAPLGRGAASEVHVAYDPSLDRKVALKLMRVGKRSAERVLGEARLVAQLKHPAIVDVFDVGVAGDYAFVAMELAHHGSARTWLETARPSWRQVVAIYLDAAKGLAHAHAANVLHLDVKPDNVLVLEGPRGVMGDFGLARRLVTDPTDGKAVGTPAYIAPEQYRGETVGTAADQFSLCASLWEALTGERPFEGTSRSDLERSIVQGKRRPFPPERGVPRAVVRVLERGLSPQVAQRFATVGELCVALERALEGPRWGLWATAAVVLLGATLVGAVELRRPRVCLDEVGADLADPELMARMRSDLSATLAAEVWAECEPKVRAYASQLRTARLEACGRRGWFGDSAAVAWERSACLGERQAALETLFTGAGAGGYNIAYALREVVNELAPPAACLGPTRANDGAAAVPEAERETVASMRAEIARVRTLAALWFQRRASDRAAQLEARVGAATPAAVRVEVLLASAEALYEGRVLPAAELTLGRALAASGADPGASTRAWDLLAQVRLAGGYLDDAQAAVDSAQRGAKAAGPLVERGVAFTRAQVLDARGEWDLASASYADVLRLEASGQRSPWFRQRVLMAWANLLTDHGELERGLATAREAVELAKATEGAAHPSYALALDLVARLESASRLHDAALTHAVEAVSVHQRLASATLAETTQSGAGLARALLAHGRAGEARAALERAISRMSGSGIVATRCDRAEADVAVAEVMHRLDPGDPRVRPLAEEALDIARSLGPRRAPLAQRAVALLRPEAGPAGCVPRPGSRTPTPDVDEDCDGNFDNVASGRRWVIDDATPRRVVDNGCAPEVIGQVGDACFALGCPHSDCWAGRSGDISPVCSGAGFGAGEFAGGTAKCVEVLLYY